MKKTHGFEKFANKKKAGTVKEQYKKERRVEKKEREEGINQRFEEKRKTRSEHSETPKGHIKRSDLEAGPVGGKRGFPAATGRPARPGIKKAGAATGRNITRPAAQSPAAKSPDAAHKQPTQAHAQQPATQPSGNHTGSVMPLNKFIAHCGICARRDAAMLVKEGGITVNGQTITEPGFKVTEKDEVKLKGKRISISKNLVYILLNKPKDYLTTTDDPQGRKTVLDLIKAATNERVYPIGRLDRNTSGVLLLTNDGELAQTLSHPKNQVKKVYEVKLDRPLTKTDFETIINGITLEDGFVAPDALGYADPKDKSVIGIEIHSGRNRIVRRIFEHLKYDVRGLDRVMYAGLTKKNVNRGKWRFLAEKEVRILKHFSKDGKKEKKQQ